MGELLANSERTNNSGKTAFSNQAFALGLLLGACLAMVLLLRPRPVIELPQAHQNPELSDSLQLIEDALQQINSDYIQEIPAEQLAEAALKGIFQELDSHSKYLNKSNYKKLIEQTDGEFLGVGIDIEEQAGHILISGLVPDSPAAQIGLRLGDEIITINEQNVQRIPYSQAINLIHDASDSVLSLNILREASTFDVQLSRELITINSIKSTFIPHANILAKNSKKVVKNKEAGIAYARITHFNEYTARDLKEKLLNLQTNNQFIYGLVLDLRNNPGGLVDAAVEVADLFLDKGIIVSATGRASDADFKFRATNGQIFAGLPLVILINGSTASAAEIVAAALKDQNRATLVGKNSYGKGLVQTIIPIQTGALKLTTSRYYTPSGLSINERGVRPHIKSNDSDMLIAIDEINTSSQQTLPHYMAVKDPALLRAWQVLNGKASRNQIAMEAPNAQ